MYIEDEELRLLYRDASQDHLDNLEAGFLHLEQHPDDLTKLKELMRATHSLKGDSRMLGVKDAETLTHQLENLLSHVKNGECDVTQSFCDCLYQGLDAVRKIAHEAVTGEPANVSVFHMLAQLIGAGDSSESEANDVPLDQPEQPLEADITDASPGGHRDLVQIFNRSLAESPTEIPKEQPSSPDNLPKPIALDKIASETEPFVATENSFSDTYQIDTVKVEAPKLDILMTQAGELAVTKRRITRRMDDIDKILIFWESWMKDSLVKRPSLDKVDSPLDATSLPPRQNFHKFTEERLDQLGDLLKQLRANSYEDSARLETLSNGLESGILKLRQLPLSSLFNLFQRMVRDLSKQQGKAINLVIEGGDTNADKRILEEMKAPLTHLIRNAIDHGIETPSERISIDKSPTATIWLKAHQQGNRIEIDVIDDGRGLNLESIKRTALRRGLCRENDLTKMTTEQVQNLIFEPGFSTRTSVTELSGRGVGLDVVRVNIERLKGTIQVKSTPGQGCGFRFTLSTSLATTSALIVKANQTSYAIPVEFVDVMVRVDLRDIFTLEGRPTVAFQDMPLSVSWLTDLLGLPVSVANQTQAQIAKHSVPCVVLKVGGERLGIFVDDLVDQQDIVLKSHSKLLKKIRNIAGSTILGAGDVCMVLSPQDLIKSIQGKGLEPRVTDFDLTTALPRVLLVEDSVPIRTQVRRILEGAGYEVTTAVDGLDGLNKLQEEDPYDAVVSDVEMPNLNGLELTIQIRQETKYDQLPIILVTTLAHEDDKQRGVDAGANAYITKGDFDQSLLLSTLSNLI